MNAAIVVIEDEPAISDTLRFALEREGFDVRCYPLAREGEAAILSQKPDLLILDIGLPDDSGLEVLKRCAATVICLFYC